MLVAVRPQMVALKSASAMLPELRLLFAVGAVVSMALLIGGCSGSDPWGMPIRLGMKKSEVHRIVGMHAETLPTIKEETTTVVYFSPGLSLTYDKFDQVVEIAVHRFPWHGEPYTGPIVHGLHITDSLEKIQSTLGDFADSGGHGGDPVWYTWHKPPYQISISVYGSDQKLVDGRPVKKGQVYYVSVRPGI